ncbi:MAG: cupin domain-containing protein [Alphaproteobacteria bacterium]|nr:cupin domain-containing protein [Alphaproteobacteria bacterium]
MISPAPSRVATFIGAALLLGTLTPVHAGECPAGKSMDGAIETGPMTPKDVTDDVISAIDLTKDYGVDGRQLRLRKLVVQPGGIVPWHGHAERPANIYILEGEITEYRSTCAAPIVHRTGDVVAEQGAVFHWWKNEGSKPVTLLSADLLPPQADSKETM